MYPSAEKSHTRLQIDHNSVVLGVRLALVGLGVGLGVRLAVRLAVQRASSAQLHN